MEATYSEEPQSAKHVRRNWHMPEGSGAKCWMPSQTPSSVQQLQRHLDNEHREMIGAGPLHNGIYTLSDAFTNIFFKVFLYPLGGRVAKK